MYNNCLMNSLMNTINEIIEIFFWKSQSGCIWQENPDLFDDTIAQIHSEAAVFDAILQSKKPGVPSLEKITNTVKFLKHNNFWRSNPFSLYTTKENDLIHIKVITKLQKKHITDLWENNNTKILQNMEIKPSFTKIR
ncbi:unnamed protein product [Heterobilharzia americana]|nr:unnamed protein product [Heterobilharzia americana]CAH8573332.1 unnamed protein product [Heterobilharzia americana]